MERSTNSPEYSEELSETERDALNAFLRLSAGEDQYRVPEKRLLTSLALAYRRLHISN